ncbi:putative transcription factor TGA like domain-containing protein [Rosa chinensis]|uniref:Putative transcription factor TGA like domain-containing protein n=1 Tax=Rosa chinensis TaxID=74649 RepID=A0A2P6RW05_ROSCH|nr:uncharacterized protein LOC112188645 [Rosa chinensis]PRQ50604.1 putative transcription factor TGA like domain-containing protein [Rosa chinensis]
MLQKKEAAAMKGMVPSQPSMKYPDEDDEHEVKEGNGGLPVEGGFAIEDISEKFQSQCISLYKRDLSKRGEELTFEKNGGWRQEQKGRTARLEKQLRLRWELEEIIEEQVNRFHAHYNLDMVPTRLKDISQLLMPNWTPPDELASIGWFGDWRPSSILELVRCLSASCFPISASTDHLLLQLIHEIRIEEAILDEEMAEIQSTCILYLPFAPINIQSGGSALACVHSEFKKIERVITKAQQLRFKALELVLKKILNEIDAAEFLVAFEGIQDAIHQFAANQRFQKGPVAMPVKALGSA